MQFLKLYRGSGPKNNLVALLDWWSDNLNVTVGQSRLLEQRGTQDEGLDKKIWKKVLMVN